MCLLFIFISLIDYVAGGKFLIIDSISATFLVVSAIVRNERYFDYYIIRIVSLLFTLALWIVAYYEFNSKNILLLIIMYFSYLFYDIYNYYFVIKYSYLKKEEIYQKV